MINLNLLVKKAANIHHKWETNSSGGKPSRSVYLKKMDECYTTYREAGGDLMEFDRQLEKEDQTSQDNIFPESKANMFTNFGQSDVIKNFHEKKTWKEKYETALSLKDPRASFILKRLIFDEIHCAKFFLFIALINVEISINF